jgi:hypothetical protein
MDRPNTEPLELAALDADITITATITRLNWFAADLRSVERSVAAHPAGAYRDDIASGEVWPDDPDFDDDELAAVDDIDDDIDFADYCRTVRHLPFKVTGL